MSIRSYLLACLALLAPAYAQPDYFPLQEGNQWIYRSSAGTVMTLEVTRAAEYHGRLYYLLQGLPDGGHWLRRDENGSVIAYDPDRDQEQLWYAFRNPVGEPYRTFLPGSNNSPAVVTSTKAIYWGPVGWFNWALEIQYPGTFQVGTYRELFLPYVGLARREEGAGGPAVMTWDLIYLRAGGVTYVTEQSVSFGLTLDSSSYPTPGEMIARFTLRNTHWEPLRLQFSSSQDYDLVFRNDKGEIVYQWSAGKAFLQVFRTETFDYGEKNYALLLSLTDKTGRPLPAGKYSAEAWLATTGQRSYAATTGFQILDSR